MTGNSNVKELSHEQEPVNIVTTLQAQQQGSIPSSGQKRFFLSPCPYQFLHPPSFLSNWH